MQARHMPRVNARYWTAITLASLFGTNLGDFYAHETGLNVYLGVGILAVLAAVVFLAERRDVATRELYYWLVILIIRTGATNIADYLLYDVRVQQAALSFGLAAMVALFGWLSLQRRDRAETEAETRGMPATGASYWVAMLGAGVFGTVVGDICQHVFGQGTASIGLGVLLLVALGIWRISGNARLMLYWLVVAVARTTGTAMGDWLAEDELLNIGLAVATAITGISFLAVLVFAGKGKSSGEPATAR